jgi:hypothetical protein
MNAWHWLNSNSGAVEAGAAVLSAAALVYSLMLLYRQLLAQSWAELYGRMQSVETIAARARLYTLSETSVRFEDWKPEAIADIELICQRYNYFARMVHLNFLPKRRALQDWAWQFDRLWRISKPHVKNRRKRPGQGRLWEDFQWFARKSAKYLKQQGTKDTLPVD